MSAHASYRGQGIRRDHYRREALHRAASRHAGRRLRAIPDRFGELRPVSLTVAARPGHYRKGACAELEEVSRKFPQHGIRRAARARRSRSRATSLPAREMEVGRYYMNKNNYTGAINRFKVVVHAVSDHAARRRSADAPDRGLHGARHHPGGADRCRRARSQLSGQPLVQGRLYAW